MNVNIYSKSESYCRVPTKLAESAVDAFASVGMHDQLDALNAILEQPSEQHQGEPVALPERISMTKLPTEQSSRYHIGERHGWNACLDEIAKLGPLYTHADPGEVERLRGIIRMHEKTVREQADHLAYMRTQLAERDALLRDISKILDSWRNTDDLEEIGDRVAAMISASAEPSAPKYHRQSLDMDDTVRDRLTTIARKAAISSTHRYNYMPATPEDAIGWQPHAWVVEAMRMVEVKACVEVNDLNELLVHAESVQAELSGALEEVLDERDTVLAKVRWLLSEATHDYGAISAAQFEKECLAMLKQINTILSASAEPSAPQRCTCNACYRCREFRESAALMDRHEAWLAGVAQGRAEAANSEPSAPVEIDERAAFEKAVIDKAERFHPDLVQYGDLPDAEYRCANIEWAWGLWQARAALERKP